jgi:hypothetical protein
LPKWVQGLEGRWGTEWAQQRASLSRAPASEMTKVGTTAGVTWSVLPWERQMVPWGTASERATVAAT